MPIDPSPGFPSLATTRFPDRWAAAGLARLIPHLSIGAPGAVLGSLGVLVLMPGLIAAGGALLVALIWLLRRPWPPRIARERGELELLTLYERLQARAGRRRAPPETPREYGAAVSGSALDPVLAEVTDAVNEGVYGGRWPPPGQLEAWRKRLS